MAVDGGVCWGSKSIEGMLAYAVRRGGGGWEESMALGEALVTVGMRMDEWRCPSASAVRVVAPYGHGNIQLRETSEDRANERQKRMRRMSTGALALCTRM